jgi:hypothetical protein
MRVLVLGGSGFLGRHVAAALRERGHRVVIGSRHPASRCRVGLAQDCTWRVVRFERMTTRHWDDAVADVDAVANCVGILREWGEFQCDRLTACFLAQKRIAPEVQLGTMVMYMGSEKAGIRLTDYRDVPFRVGEVMFNDRSFAPVKGKTDELFSCLFHRRFARPELAFSETTAFPADQLSARNMAAKLTVSTLSDVRNTMFMSGLTPFPREHWQTLAPAMKQHAELHLKIAGHRPRGPFKHYWGEASRYVGDDNPFSLFLALGVPFEVTDELAPAVGERFRHRLSPRPTVGPRTAAPDACGSST